MRTLAPLRHLRKSLLPAALLLLLSSTPASAQSFTEALQAIAKHEDWTLVELARSAENRPIHALRHSPAAPGGPCLLILAGLQAGPNDPTKALLSWLESTDFRAKAPGFENLGVTIIPILNVDGQSRWPSQTFDKNANEKADPAVRAEAAANSQGLDLRAELLRARAPEIQALRAALALDDPELVLVLEAPGPAPLLSSESPLIAAGLRATALSRVLELELRPAPKSEEPALAEPLTALSLGGRFALSCSSPAGLPSLLETLIKKLPALQKSRREALEADRHAEVLVDGQPTTRPLGWALPARESGAARQLRALGLRVAVTLEATRLPARRWKHKNQNVDLTELPAGSFIIPADQREARLAALLLESNQVPGLRASGWLDRRRSDPHALLRLEELPALAPALFENPIPPAWEIELADVDGPDPLDISSSSGRARWLSGHEVLLERPGRRLVLDAETGALRATTVQRPPVEALDAIPGFGPADHPALSRAPWMHQGQNWILNFSSDLYLVTTAAETLKARRLTFDSESEELLQLSPDGRLLSYVKENDLYLCDLDSASTWRLSKDGGEDILNGKLDWVYQEEVFGRGQFRAFWFSPDSRHLAFLRIDQSAVPRAPLVDRARISPELQSQRYPRAGDPLPKLRLGFVSTRGGPIRWIAELGDGERAGILARVHWSPDGSQLLYQVQDRIQTWLELRAHDLAERDELLLRETSPAWVEVNGEPHWLDKDRFLWLSERNGRRQIFQYSLAALRKSKKSKDSAEALTNLDWHIERVLHLDAAANEALISAIHDRPQESHVYKLNLKTREIQQITRPGESHSVSVSPDGRYLLDSSSAWSKPPAQRILERSGKVLRELTGPLEDRLSELAGPQDLEWLQLPARDGLALRANLIRAPGDGPKAALILVYGGPQAPSVREGWRGNTALWHRMLAQRGIQVITLDNRLASGLGLRDAWPSYRKLGEGELRDLEDAIKALSERKILDPEAIALSGWSYGGYFTSYALTHSKLFKLGFAGAPVTDWRSYDAIYTERYMGLPKDNPEGYKSSSVLAAADSLSGRLILIHGGLDDNVHPSNSLQLLEALQERGADCDLWYYPTSTHGLRSYNLYRDLRLRMTRELFSILKPKRNW